MKKFLVILIAFLGISYSASAQSGSYNLSNGDYEAIEYCVEDSAADGTVYITFNSNSEYTSVIRYKFKYLHMGQWPGEQPFTSEVFTATIEPYGTSRETPRITVYNKNRLLRIEDVIIIKAVASDE